MSSSASIFSLFNNAIRPEPENNTNADPTEPPPKKRVLTPEEEYALTVFNVDLPSTWQSSALFNVKSRENFDPIELRRLVTLLYQNVLSHEEYSESLQRWFNEPMALGDEVDEYSVRGRMTTLVTRLAKTSPTYAAFFAEVINEIVYRLHIDRIVSDFKMTGRMSYTDMKMPVLSFDGTKEEILVKTFQHNISPDYFPFVIHSEWLWRNIVYTGNYADSPGAIWVGGPKAETLSNTFRNKGASISERVKAFKGLKDNTYLTEHVIALCEMLRDNNVFLMKDFVFWLVYTWLPQFVAQVRESDYIRVNDALKDQKYGENSDIVKYLYELFGIVNEKGAWWINVQNFINDVNAYVGDDVSSQIMRRYMADYILVAVEAADEMTRKSALLWLGGFGEDQRRLMKEKLCRKLPPRYSGLAGLIDNARNEKANYLMLTRGGWGA